MNNVKLILLLCVVIGFGSACKSKKGQTKTEGIAVTPYNSKMMLVKSISERQNDFSYYSATGQLDYKDENLSQELGVNIVMEKDQYLYMNITALLGISVARVFAAPDSLVILDILHRKAIIANYDYVLKMTGADLRLANLQNVIIGNTLFPYTEGQYTVDSLSNTIQIIRALSQTISQKTLYTNLLKVTESQIRESSKKQELSVRYLDVYTQGSNLFPSQFNINIRAEKNIDARLELKTFVFEKKKDIQFSVPKSYERIRL